MGFTVTSQQPTTKRTHHTHTKERTPVVALRAGRPDGFDRDLLADLVFLATTELATDGLLRPGEIMPKKGFISQSDVTFEHDGNGKLISAAVMILPIKRHGKHAGDTTKRPVVIKANRGGALQTAELLGSISMIAPCRPGDEETTAALRFPVTKTAGLNRRDQKPLANLALRKLVKWHHGKCAAVGVPHHEKVMPHSCRIGGAWHATACFTTPPFPLWHLTSEFLSVSWSRRSRPTSATSADAYATITTLRARVRM